MDDRRFDSLTKAFARGASRRGVLKGLLGLGSAAVAGGIAFEGDAEARRRPKPAPKPTTCPGDQTWNGTECECPDSAPNKCGPACCNETEFASSHRSECCDNACCFGTCYLEEQCCPTNVRIIDGGTYAPSHKVCETDDGPLCCPFFDDCCLIDGCCATICFGGTGIDRCCSAEDYCPGDGASPDLCCAGGTTCCGAGTSANTCCDNPCIVSNGIELCCAQDEVACNGACCNGTCLTEWWDPDVCCPTDKVCGNLGTLCCADDQQCCPFYGEPGWAYCAPLGSVCCHLNSQCTGACQVCSDSDGGYCISACKDDEICCGSGKDASCCDTATNRCCDGNCTDTEIDSDNCGECGTVCPGCSTCRGGTCVPDDSQCDEKDDVCCPNGDSFSCEQGPNCGCDGDGDCAYLNDASQCKAGYCDVADAIGTCRTRAASSETICQPAGESAICEPAVTCDGETQSCPGPDPNYAPAGIHCDFCFQCDGQGNCNSPTGTICGSQCCDLREEQCCIAESGPNYCVPSDETCCFVKGDCTGDCEVCGDNGYCVSGCGPGQSCCTGDDDEDCCYVATETCMSAYGCCPNGDVCGSDCCREGKCCPDDVCVDTDAGQCCDAGDCDAVDACTPAACQSGHICNAATSCLNGFHCDGSNGCVQNCVPKDGTCTGDGDCCSSLCQGSRCVDCKTSGGRCADGGDCCSGLCQDTACVDCKTGGSCAEERDCCSGWNCSGGTCVHD